MTTDIPEPCASCGAGGSTPHWVYCPEREPPPITPEDERAAERYDEPGRDYASGDGY